MTEKRLKYMVYELDKDSACPVWAYIDNGKVVAYHHDGDSDIETPEKFMRFFDTEDEANEFITKEIAHMKDAARDTRELLQRLYDWEGKYGNDANAVKLDEFIPSDVQYHYKSYNDAMYEGIIMILVRCARYRVLEVAGVSIPMDSINRIEWNDKEWRATIVLDGNAHIYVNEENGYRILRRLFDHIRKI